MHTQFCKFHPAVVTVHNTPQIKDGHDGLDTPRLRLFSPAWCFSLSHFSVSLVCKQKSFYSCHCNLRHITSESKLSLSILFSSFLSTETQMVNHIWQVRLWTSNYLYSCFARALSVRFSLSEMCLWYGWELIWQGCHSVSPFLLLFDTAGLDPQTQTQGIKGVFRVY